MKKSLIIIASISLLFGSHQTYAFWTEHKTKIGWTVAGAAVIASLIYLLKESKITVHCKPHDIPGVILQVLYKGTFHDIHIIGEEQRDQIRAETTLSAKSMKEIERIAVGYEQDSTSLTIYPKYFTDTSRKQRDYKKRPQTHCSQSLYVPIDTNISFVNTEITGTVTVLGLRKQQIIAQPDKERAIQFLNHEEA